MEYKYDFEKIIDRRGMDAMAVDSLGEFPGFAPEPPEEGFDVIPMWVADMNFETAPQVVDAMRMRLDHPLFGYFSPREEYYDAIINWQRVRNGVEDLTAECIGYENGVLGGLVAALRAYLEPGDKVLVHSPTYIGFTNSLKAAGFEIVHSRLVQDENGTWRMDYDDMDAKIREHGIRAAIFCNPHNPCGRVWTEDEILRANEVYSKYNCLVISDEIWSDLILDDNRHTPYQSVSEDAKNRTVALYAPSKTFSLAGLVGSYHIIYNGDIRRRVHKASAATHYNSMNVLSMYALIGAYSEDGMEWVDELRTVLSRNVRYTCDYILERFDGVKLSRPEGTYMLFIDCTDWCKSNDKDIDELLHMGWKVGVAWQDGRPFHGEHCIRLNLALPTSRVEEAMDRLNKYVFNCK